MGTETSILFLLTKQSFWSPLQDMDLWEWWRRCWYEMTQASAKVFGLYRVNMFPAHLPAFWMFIWDIIGLSWWKNHWSRSSSWHSYSPLQSSPKRWWNKHQQHSLHFCLVQRPCPQVAISTMFEYFHTWYCLLRLLEKIQSLSWKWQQVMS